MRTKNIKRWRDPRVWFGLTATSLFGVIPGLIVWGWGPSALRAPLLLMIALLTSSALYAAWRFAPWYPTRATDLSRIALAAALQPKDVFYDVGCGDGRVVDYMSRRTTARCIGIELSLIHFAAAKLRQRIARRENFLLMRADMFQVDLSDASAVYFYGIRQTMQRQHISEILQKLSPGTRLISYDYPIEGLMPKEINESPGGLPIYLYVL